MPPDTQHHICIQKSSIQPTLLLRAAAMAMIWKEWAEVGGAGEGCVLVPGLLYGATAWVWETHGKAGQLTHISYQEAVKLVDSLHLCDISSYPQ